MSRLTPSRIESLLREGPSPEPPPELLDRLREDLPDELEGPVFEDRPRQRRTVYPWALAASVLAALGGGYLGFQVYRQTPASETAPSAPAPLAAEESPLPAREARVEAVAQVESEKKAIEKTLQPREAPPPIETAAETSPRAQKSPADEMPAVAGTGLKKEAPARRGKSDESLAALTAAAARPSSAEGPRPEARLPEASQPATSPPPSSGPPRNATGDAGPAKGAATTDSAAIGSSPSASDLDALQERVARTSAFGTDRRLEEEETAHHERLFNDAPSSPRQESPSPSLAVREKLRGAGSYRDDRVRHFVDTEDDPFSSIPLDVGTSSYTIVRRFLEDGLLPPGSAVRVSEMIQSFDYGDAPPRRRDLALYAEASPSPHGAAGNRYILRVAVKAREVAERQPGEGRIIVSEAAAELELAPRVVERYRLIGFADGAVADPGLRADGLAASEIRAGRAVTALYELELRQPPHPRDELGILRIRYRSERTGSNLEDELVVTGNDVSPSWQDASPALHLATVVAEFGELLGGSYRSQEGDLEDVFQRAQEVSAEFPGDHEVAELATWIGRAAKIEPREGD